MLAMTAKQHELLEHEIINRCLAITYAINGCDFMRAKQLVLEIEAVVRGIARIAPEEK